MQQPYRPQFHFSPPRNWMNDPDGLVYYDDEYHLFYQHNPDAMVHGTERPMHWGHAVSADLVRWTHLPIALVPDHLGDIWSGCAVVDWEDSSGFFGGEAGLVAIFTQGLDSLQQQSIAYSRDKGRTWTMFARNPILTNPGLRDMRDPNVFWHASTRRWVMVLACGDHVRIYTSPNLIGWTQISSFGQSHGSHAGVWECPDLFQLPVDGDPNAQKWVLTVSLNGRIQYFVGQFTGDEFINDNAADVILWADYGRDIYAAVTWSDTSLEAGRRVWIGWMADPAYADRVPTNPWRGSLTVPRLLDLRSTAQGVRLAQSPFPTLQRLRGPAYHGNDATVAPGTNLLADMSGRALEIVGEFTPVAATEFGFRVRTNGAQYTTIGYEPATSTLFVDRTDSGLTSFSPSFPGRHEAPLPLAHGAIKLHIFVDWSSIEVFGNDGNTVITDLIFPDSDAIGLELYSRGGAVALGSLDIYPLMSIWEHDSSVVMAPDGSSLSGSNDQRESSMGS
jgi:fructan beta-fructosidase